MTGASLARLLWMVHLLLDFYGWCFSCQTFMNGASLARLWWMVHLLEQVLMVIVWTFLIEVWNLAQLYFRMMQTFSDLCIIQTQRCTGRDLHILLFAELDIWHINILNCITFWLRHNLVHTVNPLYLASIILIVLCPKCISVLLF